MALHDSFLERTGVQAELLAALGQLSVLQPEDPINFLCKHFENLVKSASEPSQACVELLRDADTINPGQLDSAVYKAFKMLQGTDTDMTGDVLAGRVDGVAVNTILTELCVNLDPVLSDSLLTKLKVSPEALFSFPTFSSVLTPRLNLQAYLKIAGQVFESIDVQQTGSIQGEVGEELLSRLSDNIGIIASAEMSAEMSGAAVTVVSPSEVTTIIKRSGQSGATMTLTEFKTAAGLIFINNIPLRV